MMLILGIVGIGAGALAIPERIPLGSIAGDNEGGDNPRSFDAAITAPRNEVLGAIAMASWPLVGGRFVLSVLLVVVGWKTFGDSTWRSWVLPLLAIGLLFGFAATGLDIWYDIRMFQVLFAAVDMTIEAQWFALLYLIGLVICVAASGLWLLMQIVLYGIALISMLRQRTAPSH